MTIRKEKIIRVSVMNNYDFSAEEEKQLSTFENTKHKIFVNSNSFGVITAERPSIITINPYLKFNALKGDISNIKALRIKLFVNSEGVLTPDCIDCIKKAEKYKIPFLLTFQRFNRKATMVKFTGMSGNNKYYHQSINKAGKYTGGYKCLQSTKALITEQIKAITAVPVFICDQSGKGCVDCMNCSLLTFQTDKIDIYSLNLSKSGNNGKCQYNCPDCFAKKCLAMGGGRPSCDKIKQNVKQTGYRTKKDWFKKA